MNNVAKIISGVLFLVFTHPASQVNAQDVYLSISGQNSQFLSGDNRHEYEIWVKPGENPQNGTLQIYDAGLGGAVDLITNRSTTITQFEVFPFNELYTQDGPSVQKVADSTTALTQLTTRSEERYKNRWVPLTSLSPDTTDGYLVRVQAGKGSDVNNFNLRVVDDNGEVVDGDSWSIIAIDLSIGFYRSSPENYFQIRPYNPQDRNQDLITAGEEDSQIEKMDAFGNMYPLQDTDIPVQQFGLSNSWGLTMSGSNEIINNFTIYGSEQPVLWVFDPVLVNQQEKPFANVLETVTNSCTEFAFELQSNAFSAEALQSALWLLNNQQIGTGPQPLIAFEKRGSVNLNVLVPNQSSYFPEYWNYPKEVFINTPPVAKLSAPKEIISPGEQITLSAASSYDLEEQELSYTWFVNGNRRSTGPEFQFSNTISGSYRITVRVSDGGTSQQCSNTEVTKRIRVNTQPYAEIAYTPLFGTDESINFRVTNQSDADNDRLFYEWQSTGLVENSIGESITIRHQTPGEYDVTLTVNDSSKATNAAYTTTRQYEVNAAPQVAFNAPQKVAPGNEFTLNAAATSDQNDAELTYRWYVADEEINGGVSATHILNEPGTYDIRLVVDDELDASNSVQELTKSIRVNDAPQPGIIAPEMTSSSLVQMEAQRSDDIQSYRWDFGDGNTASGPNAEHLYQQPGTYTITLTVDDGEALSNSIQRTQQQLIVNKFPVANFQIPDVVAPNENFTADGSLSLDEDGLVESYDWYIDGIPAGNGVQPTLNISQAGMHSISLRVKDNSGFDIAQGLHSETIRVNKAPVPKWKTVPAEPVPDNQITFTASDSYDPDGEIVEYTWTFEDGITLRGRQVERSFDESGTKNFTLTVTDNDRIDNSTVTTEESVALNHQPYIVTEPAIRSNALEVKLDAAGSYDLDEDPLDFEWTLPDGSKRSESTFSWKAPEPGVHIISLQVDDGRGLPNSQNEELIRVLINRPVKAVVDSLINSCTGQTVLFNSSRSYDPDGDAFQVNWNFGDGTTSDQANPSHSYEKPGVYEAKLTLNDRFTEKETVAKIPVIVEGSPIARMNVADTTICVNSAIEFDGSASSDPSGSLPSFSWDLGDGNSETGPKVRHVFTEPGEYIVSLTVEGSGSGMCSNISQVTGRVRVIEGPEASFELPEWSAPGEEVILDGTNSVADGGFRNVEWLIENADTTFVETGLETSHVFNEPGEYFVTLNLQTNTSTSCNTVSLTKTIKVNASPKISWNLPKNITAGTDLKLDATSSADPDGFIKSYRWFYNDSLISRNVTEIIKAVKPGTHTIKLEVKDNSVASNNTEVIEKTFFANSAPKPVIAFDEIRYKGQKVEFKSLRNTDGNGDQLTNTWFLDGEEIENPAFTPTEQRPYRMVLVQNDGRNLPNSIDSAIVTYIPKKLPMARPLIPDAIIKGGTLDIRTLGVSDDGWKILQDGTSYDSVWTASTVPTDTLHLAWIHEGERLKDQRFPVSVKAPLAFTDSIRTFTLSWNPANPTTIVEAPTVNRDADKVSYTWLSDDGEVIGKGTLQEVALRQGENAFTVQVKDLEVEQSLPIETELIIITE